MTLNDILISLLILATILLIGALIFVLLRVATVLATTNTTVKEVQQTITVITKDVDSLSSEVEGLLSKSNTLLLDINQKLGKTDPLFTAVGDLGQSVSRVNESANNFASRVKLKKPAKTGASIVRVSDTVSKILNKKSKGATK